MKLLVMLFAQFVGWQSAPFPPAAGYTECWKDSATAHVMCMSAKGYTLDVTEALDNLEKRDEAKGNGGADGGTVVLIDTTTVHVQFPLDDLVQAELPE